MTNPLDLAVQLRRSGSRTYTIEGNVNTGGAEKISELTDVDLTGLLDGYILVYDATAEEWKVEAKAAGSGAENLSELADVDLTGLADDYILVYDSTTSKWIVEAKPTGGTGDFTVIATRDTATIASAASVAAGAQTQFDSIINGKAVRLYTIETNVPMRVRIYTDSTSATADASRAIGTDPATNSGCLFEFVTTPSLLISKLSPLVDIFSDNIDQEDFTFILSNLDDTTSILEVTFTYIMQEI